MTPDIRVILLICLLLGISISPAGADTTSLYPRAVFEGDIAELVIEHDSRIASLYALDTTPLQDNFEILDTKSRVLRLDRDGKTRHRMQWRLQLLPRKNGTLDIPALAYGDHLSSPLTLEVKPVTDLEGGDGAVFLELEAIPESPYAGQQTGLVLRLFHNLPLRIDGLSEPGIEDARIFRLEREKIYFTRRDDREFRVLERRFQIFPRTSGQLELTPAILRGQIRHPGNQSSNPGEARKISRSSNPLSIVVREPPADFNGQFWLPAREIRISQSFEKDNGELAVGDSLDWNLILEAKGLNAEALPGNLLEFEADNYAVYADNAKLSNRFEGEDLVGRLEQRFAVIFTGEGEARLPDVSLQWWNVDLDSARLALIEGRRYVIGRETTSATARVSEKDRQTSFGGSITDAMVRLRHWIIISLVLLGMSWLACRPLLQRLAVLVRADREIRRLRQGLYQACREENPGQARRLLIEWGRLEWPEGGLNGLHEIVDRTGSPTLAAELRRLDAILYSGRPQTWNGLALWTAFKRYSGNRRHTRAVPVQNSLPGLYPGLLADSIACQPSAGSKRLP